MRRVGVLFVVGAIGLVGCSSSGHQSASTTTSTPASALTIGPGPSGSSSTSSTSSTTASTSSTLAAGGSPKNLVATAALKAQLLTAFAAAKGVPPSDFTGPDPGTTYYAVVPSTGTYWALAHFTPTSSAGYQVDVGMQDGGAEGVFTEAQGSTTWSVKFGTFPFPCPGGPVPDALVKLWGMSYPSGCGQG